MCSRVSFSTGILRRCQSASSSCDDSPPSPRRCWGERPTACHSACQRRFGGTHRFAVCVFAGELGASRNVHAGVSRLGMALSSPELYTAWINFTMVNLQIRLVGIKLVSKKLKRQALKKRKKCRASRHRASPVFLLETLQRVPRASAVALAPLLHWIGCKLQGGGWYTPGTWYIKP